MGRTLPQLKSVLRASIIIGVKLARSDVGERENRTEKKASDSRDAGKNGRNALSWLLLHSGYSTSHLIIKYRTTVGNSVTWSLLQPASGRIR
jgi:hypothetical protein